MEEDMYYSIIKDKISMNNESIIVDVKIKVDEIIQLLCDNKPNNVIISQLKNIITIISNNQLKLDKLINDMMIKINNINYNIKQLINSNSNSTYGTKIYDKQREDFLNGKYVGEFKNGLRDGKGVFYRNDGGRYEGEYKNDVKNGKGITYYSNGGRYEGDYKNDVKDGKGIFYFADGARYEGDWKNDYMDGKGIVYYTNGDREMGDFKEGKGIGVTVYLTKEGEIIPNKH